MFISIPPVDIYNKNINLLIGSGASADLFPTLGLAITNNRSEWETIETLATRYESDLKRKTALFMHYYNTCISPVQSYNPERSGGSKKKANTKNYQELIKTIVGLLDKRKDLSRKVNIFTTNYDGCLPFAADSILTEDTHQFAVNDGTAGFRTKHLHIKNFHRFQCQASAFERHNYGIPQINLINLHGSVYWRKDSDKIKVDYDARASNFLSARTLDKLEAYSEYLVTKGGTTEGIPSVQLTSGEISGFWDSYNALPIVNPTKWKFHETVFEEHYYQMLRLLSYELEKPNSILITFGFSFADEHILKLVQRSLTNPTLKAYVCCYSASSAKKLAGNFKAWTNVDIIGPPDGEVLDFTNFNKYIFSLKPEVYSPPDAEEDL